MTPGPDLSPRKVLRIARWEVGKTVGVVRRRTLLLALVGVLVAALAGPTVLAGDASLESGIYRVGVDGDSPYRDVVASDDRFAAAEPSAAALREGRIEVLVDDGRIRLRDTEKGRAAHAAFRSAIAAYNDELMEGVAEGGDERAADAAFPVDVVLRYEARAEATDGGGSDTDTDTDTDAGSGGGDGGGGGVVGGGGGGGGPIAVPSVGGGGRQGSPSAIAPPFPFTSLILGFLFIVPMNFVVQSYGSTIMDERINRRGELLLVSPVSPADIVVGKTLPYFSLVVAITAAIAVALNGGLLSVVAVLPLAVAFLAATFVGAMFARSFKELTFVTVTVSVTLTTFAFVPAIFTDVTPIALISPLTIVVRDLQGAGASLPELAFSTLPTLLTGVVLFALGAGVYREEDMFTQRPVHLKAMDALAARIRRPRSLVAWTALFIPFVFVAELLALALLWVLPVPVTVVGLLVVIAVIEEVAKSAGAFAGFEHARYDRSAGTALLVGSLAGLGFFVGEKFVAIAQVAGIPSLQGGQGQPIFPAGAEGIDPALAVALLLAPLALHTVTASISALGARKDSTWWLAGMAVAVVVHTAYNLAVVGVIGGGL